MTQIRKSTQSDTAKVQVWIIGKSKNKNLPEEISNLVAILQEKKDGSWDYLKGVDSYSIVIKNTDDDEELRIIGAELVNLVAKGVFGNSNSR